MSNVTAGTKPAPYESFRQPLPTKVSIGEAQRPKRKRNSSSRWDMPGFAAGSRVRTTQGSVPIEVIGVNDSIRTASGKTRRVRRVNKITLDRELLERHPEAQPVRVGAGALAKGLPENDLVVSPGQVLVPMGEGTLRWRTAAGDIHRRPNIVRVSMQRATYYVIELEEPDTAFVEGATVFLPVWPED